MSLFRKSSLREARLSGLTLTRVAIIRMKGNGVCLPRLAGNRRDWFRANDSCSA